MARINIEDSLFKDGRFTDLAIKLGCRRMALGAIIEAFIVAQSYYLNTETDRLIPVSEWKRKRLSDELIDVGLAELKDKGIYVVGSKEQFAWLIQRHEAGKKGGRPKSNIEDLRKASALSRLSEETGSNPLTPTLPLTLSLIPSLAQSPTLAHTQIQEELNTITANRKKKSSTTPKQQDDNRKIWIAYSNAYRLRYGVDPIRNARCNKSISQIRERIGAEDGCRVVEFFLAHNDSFYLKKTHDIGLCLRDSETLRTQMMRGKAITGTMVRAFEKTMTNQELNERIEREGI